MRSKLNSRVLVSSLTCLSVSAHASSLGEVMESFRQNRYALANGAGSYDNADPADRKVIAQYYSELESASLLQPMARALEETATNSQAMISAMQRAIAAADPVSSEIESCMGVRDLPVHQNILTRSARSARAQVESGYARSKYTSPIELDLNGTINAYNTIASRNWTDEFVRCCKRESLNKLDRTGTRDNRQTQTDRLRSANENASQKLGRMVEEGGCDDLAQDLSEKQNAFVQQDYTIPSRVLDPLEGLKMSAVELATVLRSSGVRGGLRTIRETSPNATSAMFQEMSYFGEIDDSCKRAKEKEANRGKGLWPQLIKGGLNLAICHFIPQRLIEKSSPSKAKLGLLAADLTAALPYKELQCDPAVTAAYRSQIITDKNKIADMNNIPQIQNSLFVNRLRSMMPLSQVPIVRAPDGSVILPGGIIGNAGLTREEFEAQYEQDQGLMSTRGIVNSTADRDRGLVGKNRLAFMNGPGGSIRYVRSTDARTLVGRSISNSVRSARALAGNISSASNRAAPSAAALKASAGRTRALAGDVVNAAKKRGLAATSTLRTKSATVTRNLVSRSIASKSSRVSAEWLAKILHDRRAGKNAGTNTNSNFRGNGATKITSSEEEQRQKRIDELYKGNERRRQNLIAQADSMVNSIQKAVSRSSEIVAEIQTKLAARDVMFNKTVDAMAKKGTDGRFTLMRSLLSQDAVKMQELATLKAEYDALSYSIPMLTSSLTRLGNFSSKVSTNSLAGSTIPTAGNDGRFNNTAGTSVFAPSASSIALPSSPNVSSEFATQNSILDSFSLKMLFPQAWALGEGSMAYEQRWAQVFDTFASDWDKYLEKLREAEQDDRKAVSGRYRELAQTPAKLELLEPDADTFGLMWDTMEVISDESKDLLQLRREENKNNLSRNKVFQDIESAQLDADKSIDLLGEWGDMYIKSAPKSYYEDPQAWEVMIPDTIAY